MYTDTVQTFVIIAGAFVLMGLLYVPIAYQNSLSYHLQFDDSLHIWYHVIRLNMLFLFINVLC